MTEKVVTDKLGNVYVKTTQKVADKIQSNEDDCCPLCNSEKVDYSPYEIDDVMAYQECECQECGATWKMYYRLSFITNDSIEEG